MCRDHTPSLNCYTSYIFTKPLRSREVSTSSPTIIICALKALHEDGISFRIDVDVSSRLPLYIPLVTRDETGDPHSKEHRNFLRCSPKTIDSRTLLLPTSSYFRGRIRPETPFHTPLPGPPFESYFTFSFYQWTVTRFSGVDSPTLTVFIHFFCRLDQTPPATEFKYIEYPRFSRLRRKGRPNCLLTNRGLSKEKDRSL